MPTQQPLSMAEIQLLIAFEKAPSLELLSRSLRRDLTVISKALKQISQKSDFVVKVANRWVLTDAGRRLNQLSMDYLNAQALLVAGKQPLRLGTNREFSALILGKHFQELQDVFRESILHINVFESGVEEALVNGSIDLGFDCGRPRSPEVQFKSIIEETVAGFAAKELVKASKEKAWSDLPYIACQRLSPPLSHTKAEALKAICYTNDIATARSLCLQSVGWTFLPTYCVQDELRGGQLVELPSIPTYQERYGVWKLRSRRSLQSHFERACEWLEKIDLK